ncbi:hypothetical protein [Actinomadura geliboluensis]|uniref:hypothetical protein n=1 Tax=Actinomadura geliboluensis TaxID=882440 RepID=UPI0036ABDFFF
MAPRDGEPLDRSHIKKDLLGAAQRLGQHHKHLSAKELRELDKIVDELAEIHTDEDACLNLRRKYSDLPAPPWGTRYAFWWDRGWWWLRRHLTSRE